MLGAEESGTSCTAPAVDAGATLLAHRSIPNYLWIVPVIFLEFLILGLPAAVMPKLLSDALGDDAITMLGVSAGVKGLLSFVTNPVVGALSDRALGRRLPIFITSVGTALPYAVFLLGPSVPAFLAVNAACGVFLCTFSLVMAYVADTTTDATRTRAYGVALAAFGVSFAGGPFAGSVLVEALGARALGWTIVALAAANLAYIGLVLPESRPTPSGPWVGLRSVRLPALLPRALWSNRAVGVLALVALTDELAEQLLVTLLLQYLQQRFALSTLATAAVLAEVGCCSALSLTVVLAGLKRSVGDFAVLRLGLLANAVAIVALGAAWLAWQVYVAVSGLLLAALVFPAIVSMAAASAPPHAQAETQGAIAGVKSLCDGLSPLLYGPLFAAFRETPLPGAPFVIAGGLVALALAAISQPPVAAIFRAVSLSD